MLDIKLAEDLALLESQNEFIERYNSAKASNVQKTLPMLASSCPGKVPTIVICRLVFEFYLFCVLRLGVLC